MYIWPYIVFTTDVCVNRFDCVVYVRRRCTGSRSWTGFRFRLLRYCLHQVVVDDIEKRLSQLLKHCQYIGVSRGAA